VNVTRTWHLLTGEYPPQPGGVSDYTYRVACGLAAGGDEVRVWAPVCGGEAPEAPGVTVHRLPGNFGPRGLLRLHRALRRSRGDVLLVQYVPHMYGWRAMNLPLCLWLWGACPLWPWVMFHEVAFPLAWAQPSRHNLLGAVHRVMAALVGRAANRVFVSTPAWLPLLPQTAAGRAEWLPVPSNVGTEADPGAVRAVRQRAAGGRGGAVLGHFGTFGGAVAAALEAVLPRLLRADAARSALLIGHCSEAFACRLLATHADLAGRVTAAGTVGAGDVAAHLRACDLLVQPYPDGVTGRRGSLMAGLALGVPAVTTHGALTEPLWREERLTALVHAGDDDALAAEAERLLADPAARARLGERGHAGYARHFSIERTVRRLCEAAQDTTPPRPGARSQLVDRPPRCPEVSTP
jgi:glycosyltransferase involved in cell wall biosynthesis